MNIRALTLDLKKSEYLDDKKREAMIEQYDKIPTFWKERSKQIKWEFILTDEMPLKQNEGKKIALIAESSKKKTAEYVYKWYTGEIFTHHMINIPSYLEIGDGVIDEKIEMVIDTINLLPRNLLRSFVFQHNGKIKLKAGHIFRKPKYACEGTYNYTRNTVSITVLTTNLQMIILHEFGHVLDEYCSMPSIRDDFLFIFNDERELAKNFCRNEFEYKYISSNSMEFFAETFARYISSKEVLPPRTYHFLKNLVL